MPISVYTMRMPKFFTWLLFGDLKIETGEAWSDDFLEGLLLDLSEQSVHMGPFDAVFFTGDFASNSKRSDYENCSALLRTMFARVPGMSRTPMFCVPGNHDFSQTTETTELSFFSEPNWKHAEYRELSLINKAFVNYQSWANRWQSPQIRLGVMPGDFSASLEDSAVGIVGLNTAINQGPPAPKWIPLDSARLDSACGKPLENWADDYRVRFLLTHHPPKKFVYLRDRLPSPKRGFQLHLCGHAHGDLRWPLIQGDSSILVQVPHLCPEEHSDSGYLAGAIDLENPSKVSVRFRMFSRELQRWRSAHEIQEVLTFAIPASKKTASRAHVPKLAAAANEPIYIESLRLRGFRCFDQLNLEFNHQSRLPGEWTCIAGINGAGKSSVLQSLSLALLGEPLVRELGGERLNRLRRLTSRERHDAEIEVVLRSARHQQMTLSLMIGAEGDIVADSNPSDIWQSLRSRVIASYGATRNLSSRIESGYESLSADVRRQMSMFDPLSQLAVAETLLKQQLDNGPLLPLFQNVVREVFDTELQVDADDGLRFAVAGKDHVEAMDLPDGFRASAAWIADLCAIWCEKAPAIAANASSADIQAIVLIDEIDLHLHPALQRKLVPKLRKAMPKVQWIVTTHSPLVLANFDSNEIIALDRDLQGQVRPLDRQILGFSSDQIYQWLMQTPPTGEAIEEVLERNESDGEPSDDEVAELLDTSPRVNEAEAHERVKKLKGIIQKLKP